VGISNVSQPFLLAQLGCGGGPEWRDAGWLLDVATAMILVRYVLQAHGVSYKER
jgi:hypothetical protein